MKRILITGGTGYLGTELIKQAYKSGYIVAATYYTSPPTNDMPIEVYWLPLDVCDKWSVEEGCAIFLPDIIIHTAFRQNEPDAWRVNVEGAHNVALAAWNHGAKLIHISSDVVFDGEHHGAYTDHAVPSPITAYGKSKAEAEQQVKEACPNATIVRTSLIYGFPDIDRHTRFVLELADGKRTACLFRDEYRCPIFVSDLAAALLEIAEHPYQGVINIAGSERLSRYEFGMLLAQAYGKDPASIASGLSAESSSPRPRNCALDTKMARSLLKTPLRGVQQTLSELIMEREKTA